MATIRAADSAELTRQIDSVRLFRHLTLSRRYHVRASQLAALIRQDARSNGPAIVADELGAHLRADLENARELLDLIATRGHLGFDVPALERTIGAMQAEIEAYMQAPEKWVRGHLLDAN
jgi:hypothetical protein